MEAIIPFAFSLTALMIPIALLAVGIINYVAKVEIKETILKLFLSLLAYFPVTFIIFLYMVSLLNATADANGNALDAKSEAKHFALILAYGVFGFVLCAFAKGSFKQTFSFFYRNSEESRTIFGTK